MRDLLRSESRQAECADHGPYTSARIGRFGGWTMCPICLQDREREEEATRSQKEKDLAAERILARLRACGVPDRFLDRTLDSFEARNEGQQRALAFARRYVEDWGRTRASGRSAVWIGRPGTGKTHLAIGICRALSDAGATAIYSTVQRAVRRVRETWDRDRRTESEAQAIAAFAQVDLLVLDEVGVQAGSSNEQTILFDILNERYNSRLPTLLLSNLGKEQVADLLGERVIDRLREDGGSVLAFDWESWRRNNVGQ